MPEGARRRAPVVIAEPPTSRIAELEAQIAARDAELDAALAREAATAEVLGVINSSPGDLAPVFDAILEKAHRLCGAAHGHLTTYDGNRFHAAATHGLPESFAALLRQPFRPGLNVARRLLAGEPIIHIPDMAALSYEPDDRIGRAAVEIAGIRTLLIIALRKDDTLLGYLTAHRVEVRPFTDKQIALLQNFASQAVIAMENARLLTETREALEQQTATAEVLQVINASPGDLAPVFDAMLEKAIHLCEAAFGTLWTCDGESFRAVALRHVPEAFAQLLAKGSYYPELGSTHERLLHGAPVVQVADIAAEARIGPVRQALVELGGARTLIAVPLRKDGAVLGAITAYRQEVRPFSNRQVALLENFAAQAVIAMENARLLTETRESLDFQTATSEVLKVISRSTFDLTPVLESVIETALRLCRAHMGSIFRLADDGTYRWAVGRGLEPAYEAIERQTPIPPGPDTLVGRVAAGGRTVQIADAQADPLYAAKDDARITRASTLLGVPLLREGVPVGVIAMARDRVEPFSGKEIALISTFAAQAVIAIENVRLLTETREALEQQQAMAEVLAVINANPGNLQPVFDALLGKAADLCGAAFGSLMNYDGAAFNLAAALNVSAEHAQQVVRVPVRPGGSYSRLVGGERLVHIPDVTDTDFYRSGAASRRALADLGGARTALWLALHKDDALLGAFVLYREEVRPFSDKQIALLQNFAAQAVIAMDNARLLDEIRRRQAELRVTFDNMGDGVAMFDGELRLAAWNRNFQQILDLPDDLLRPETTFEDYIRYLAGQGELGDIDIEAQIDGYMARASRADAFERERPDGRIIEVRHNPVPGGGFVLIYGDITERKRAEAAIRDARDAAERALAELSATQQQLVLQQKMAALGQLTAGIAHEIKNPLNFVNNFASLSNELLAELKQTVAPALATLDADTRADLAETFAMLSGNLDKIAEHGRRADGIVKSMLEHSRGGSGERRPVDLNALIEEALNLAYHGARAQDQNFNIALERDFAPEMAPIELVPQDVTRVFLNLFGNGFYAATKKARAADGGFRPVLRVATRDLGAAIEIRVRDNGAGIAPEIRDRLFQPFVTTKPTGEGTGLGLSISYDIVTQQHGGAITVESVPGAFTEFTVRLPRAAVSVVN
jgi:signal transduction histidine kinase/putative methionine-R-sulfoxide reductase with GAF domain